MERQKIEILPSLKVKINIFPKEFVLAFPNCKKVHPIIKIQSTQRILVTQNDNKLYISLMLESLMS